MKFSTFAQHLQKLEETPSRLAMTELLAALLIKLDPDEMLPASYLMQGRLVPLYKSLEFQMSAKMVLRALSRLHQQRSEQSVAGEEVDLFGQTTKQVEDAQVTALYKKLGDVGLAAEQVTSQQQHEDLELLEVFSRLKKIATFSGEGSQEQKVAALADLLGKVAPISARYIARVVVGKLRLGFSTMTMLDAMSWAVTGDKSEAKALEQIYQKQADVGLLAKKYLALSNEDSQKRLAKLNAETNVTIGVPVVPALCQRLNTSQEIIDKMEEIIVEPKYDGLRVQIHLDATAKEGDRVHVFTRNLDNITPMFPELQDVFSKLTVNSCVLDGEAIGYHKDTGELLPFQETMTRRRKHNIGAKAQEVPIRFYIFDILQIDGKDLLSQELRNRKDLLKKLFNENEVLLETPYIVTTSAEETRKMHTRYLAEGLEGAVMKQVNSPYVSGRKGWNWVKIKEAEGTTGKLTDTLDVIVMGYYNGRGKRSQFGIGAVLAGVYDKDKNEIVTIGKIGTGLTEDQLVAVKKQCDQNAAEKQPTQYKVPKELQPDVWVSPSFVMEVAADELTKSPNHTAKVALRFPRMLHIRTDKSWEQATTLEEVAAISIAK